MRTLSRLVLLLLLTGWFLLILPLSGWMLFNSQTWVGTGTAAFGFLILPLPFLMVRRQQRQQQQVWRRSTRLITLLLVGLITATLLAAPSGRPGSNSPVQHRFFREEGFPHFALANIIPESEQVNLGFLLMSYVDPILTPAQADRASVFTMDLYREMAQNDDFHELGSVMGFAYRELLGRPFDAGHYYLYIPQTRSEQPLPAIVFLHGSIGNFKTYTWVWSKLAEEEGFVIIAPSYGFGNWDQQGVVTVLQAIADAKEVIDIDENRLFLAGLSNGGLGVSQLAATAPEMFQGLILISPVMATQIVDSQSFQEKWANRPMLVVSGDLDQRIPISYVEQRISRMRQGNIDVSRVIYSGEDHFLFYSQPDDIMNEVGTWLLEIGK